MPELPEVETTIKGLNILINKKVIKVSVHTKKLRYNIPLRLNAILKDQSILAVERIAKYILIKFNNNNSAIIHLGMSGRLKMCKSNFKREKHDHVILFFKNNYTLIFNDPRKFGFIDIVEPVKINKQKYFFRLGVDALSRKLTANHIYAKIHKSSVPIKQILLNQHIVAGIGNIYASEILYDAKVSPFIKGRDLIFDQIQLLVKSIKKILNNAIKSGGSSIRDYRSADGTLGNFQSKFKVYGKDGRKVSKYTIHKSFQYGRVTYYCPELQKEQNSN